MPELKCLPSAIKAIEDRRVIGVCAVFGNLDSYNDILWPGAFAKTIQEQRARIKHVWMHDWSSPPIAVITDLQEIGRNELPPAVLEKAPDALGGLLVTREYLDTERANEILTGIKAGAITEMSFAYDPVKFDYEERDQDMVRNLREVRLYETSDVIWGANAATVAAKSRLSLTMVLGQLKAGARHSGGDMELINQVHQAIVDLGADCAGQKAATLARRAYALVQRGRKAASAADVGNALAELMGALGELLELLDPAYDAAADAAADAAEKSRAADTPALTRPDYSRKLRAAQQALALMNRNL